MKDQKNKTIKLFIQNKLFLPSPAMISLLVSFFYPSHYQSTSFSIVLSLSLFQVPFSIILSISLLLYNIVFLFSSLASYIFLSFFPSFDCYFLSFLPLTSVLQFSILLSCSFPLLFSIGSEAL